MKKRKRRTNAVANWLELQEKKDKYRDESNYNLKDSSHQKMIPIPKE